VSRRSRPQALTEPTNRPAPPGDLRLSVVVPAFEEGDVIGHTVAEILAVLGDLRGGMELVVVDDGSSDHTSDAAAAAGAHQVITLERNSGKGAAVRAGALAAKGRTVVFTDADLAYAPDQILPLLDQIEAGWDVVVGSRYVEGSTAEVPASLLRRIGGRVINLLVRLVLTGDHADTQCGLKAFRRDVAQLLFGEARIDGFAFDVELFALAERHHLSLKPSPVRVVNSHGSSVRLTRDTAVLVLDLIRISWWLRRGAYAADDPGALPGGVVGGAS
jgi:dolichyl-phosphate beta-glucosyltransferase